MGLGSMDVFLLFPFLDRTMFLDGLCILSGIPSLLVSHLTNNSITPLEEESAQYFSNRQVSSCNRHTSHTRLDSDYFPQLALPETYTSQARLSTSVCMFLYDLCPCI
jgi:hypothetical protein